MKTLFMLVFSWLLLGGHARGEEANQTAVSFSKDIAPILLDNCLACHGAKKAEGGYRVDTYEELVKAGDSGELPIAVSDEQTSELLRRLVCDASERMPAESEPLQTEQIELFKKWILGGGKFDGSNAGESLSLVIPVTNYVDPPETYKQPIPITATAFSPDGKLLVTSGYHELIIWNPEDASLVHRIKNLGQRVFSIALSPDGKTIAVGCGEPGRSGEVRLVDFNSGEIKGVVARTNDIVLDIAYRPGSNQLAVASADGSIRIIDTLTLEEIRTVASHADWVMDVSWSDDGTRLASASRDKSAKIYDENCELLSSYTGHGTAVRGISILADNKQAVSVGGDNKLHRWEIDGAKKVSEVGIGSEGFKIVRNENNLFIPCADARVLRIDLTTNTIAQQYQGHSDWVLTACYLPISAANVNTNMLASGSYNGEIRIWNVADASLIQSWFAKP